MLREDAFKWRPPALLRVCTAPLVKTKDSEAVVDKTISFDEPTPESEPSSERSVAIAIEHDPKGKAAPRVVAKGHGKLAEQILQIAFDRGVRVRSDADLAEILAAVEIDSEVPLEALAAVAEILSYVYRAQSRASTETAS